MRLRYGVLCDYAVSGAYGKPTIVGVYETIAVKNPAEPITTSTCVIHAMIDGPTALGPRHLLTHRLVNADGAGIFEAEVSIQFTPKFGNPDNSFVYTYAFLHPIELPGIGDYEWLFLIDGMRIGAIPFSVIHLPPQHQAHQ